MASSTITYPLAPLDHAGMISTPELVRELNALAPSEVRARYQALLLRPPVSKTSEALAFLADWDTLDEAVGEAGARAMFLSDQDRTDTARESNSTHWICEVSAALEAEHTKLKELVLSWPPEYIPAELGETVEHWRVDAKMFREANVARQQRATELELAYGSLTGKLMVTIRGETMPMSEALSWSERPVRAEREEAWKSIHDAVTSLRPQLAKIWRELWDLRQAIAHEAGYADFGAYMSDGYHRAYDAEALGRLRTAVRGVAGKALPTLMRRRAAALEIPSVRPWDVSGPLPQVPHFTFPDVATLRTLSRELIGRVSPAGARMHERMEAGGLIDEVSRANKTPGAYCNNLSVTGLPLIFGNYTTSRSDAETFIHETGHGMHFVRGIEKSGFSWTAQPGMEACEVASMGLEQLALRQLRAGDAGWTAEQVLSWQAEHLEGNLSFFVYGLTVDEFQERVYQHPQGGDLTVADRIWESVWKSTEDGVDWSGLEGCRAARWWRQAHPWTNPFYYIDYVIALLGALELGRKADQEGMTTAIATYEHFLDGAGMAPLADLFNRLGVDIQMNPAQITAIFEQAATRLNVAWEKIGVPHAFVEAPATGN